MKEKWYCELLVNVQATTWRLIPKCSSNNMAPHPKMFKQQHGTSSQNVQATTRHLIPKCSSNNMAPHPKIPKFLSARVTVKSIIESTVAEYCPFTRHLNIH